MHELLLKKIRASSYYSEDFEACVGNFMQTKLSSSETLQKALDITLQEMEICYQEAYNFYQADNYLEACEIFRTLATLNPFEEKYWMGLGASLQLLENYPGALRSYAVHLLLDSNNPYPHFYAYQCLKAMGEEEEAKKALKTAYDSAHKLPYYGELRTKILEINQEITKGMPW